MELARGGVNIFRLNCSHGTHSEMENIIANIRRAAKESKKVIGILLDLEGPHVRVGEIESDGVILKDNGKVILTTNRLIGNQNRVPVNYKNLVKDVKGGQIVLLDGGKIKLEVAKVKGNDIYCKVIEGGVLRSRKSVNVPGINLRLPSLTTKDLEDIKFGIKQKVDFIGVSFVRNPEDIIKIKNILRKHRSTIWIISKIEHPLAVVNIDEIINLSDGIMIARGDLGVELPREDVPVVQKQIIKKCNAMAKPVITATQMLESMMENLIPTRAEVTDVANAIFDGTDAVMLSGETAIGKHPVLVVEMMKKIILKTESNIDYDEIFILKNWSRSARNIPHAVSHATIKVAIDLRAKAIITATKSGQTARLISCHRPSTPIYAITTDKAVIRRLNLLWGVTPFYITRYIKNTDQMIDYSMNVVKKHKKVVSGDTVVITSGAPAGIAGKTNMLQINVIK